MAFKLKNGEQVRTQAVTIASATVIPAGAMAGMTTGLAVDAIETTPAIAWCPAGSADGETTCYLTVGNDFTLTGPGDAAFAVAYKGTAVDLTATQDIDVTGGTTYKVVTIGIAEDAGVVDSAEDIEVRIALPLF